MEAKILSRQIEGAQKKVEEQNFVMRKNVLKYDDVLNRHRGRIYEQRRQVLDGEDLSDQVKLWIEEVVEDTVHLFTQDESELDWDLEALTQAMAQLYRTEITAAELREDLGQISREALIEEFQADARDEYEAKEEEFGSDLMRELERFIVLQVVDMRWREHLENMEMLREGVHLRQMAQKDPLVEYTAEARRSVRGAFRSTAPAPRRIVLVDDVYTTGATASACSTVLRAAGARRVEVVTFARTLRRH
jgi:preprotein translocase subunit SecA